MAAPTDIDQENAYQYAFAAIEKHRYDNKKYPFSEEDIFWDPNAKSSSPFYCPPKLRPCPQGAVRFTERGCHNVSCYPYDRDGNVLHPTKNKPRGTNRYCFDVFSRWTEKDPNPDVMYHEWDRSAKKCRMGNANIKMWAEVPKKRRDKFVRGVSDAPPFIYHEDQPFNPIEIPRTYCENFMKISYDPEDKSCYVGPNQYVAEIFLGGLYRELF